MEQPLANANCIKVLIDHQQPQREMFTYGVSDTMKSSTCEMVYEFIENSPYTSVLNKDIATCLYTGMVTDRVFPLW